jgi:ribose 5-phosphate isomerase B
MSIFIGADHRGFELKQRLMSSLADLHLIDLGAESLDLEDDYNDYAVKVAKAVLAEPGSFGIIVCGAAQGVCMQANRFKGIRGAYCGSVDDAGRARAHNDANVVCLAADFDSDSAESIVQKFLQTEFLPEERYIRRNNKLDEDY